MENERRIGLHTSIAGGLPRSIERAAALGCRTLQIFSHNPRGWQVQRRDAEEIRAFREIRRTRDLSPLSIHTSYLINLASQNPDVAGKSISMLVHEMEAADALGADFVILHPGSSSAEDATEGRKRVVRGLREVGERGNWKAGLLLENTAGERGDLTSRIGEIAEIIEKVPPGLVTGVCIDTCHAFAAGYDIRTEEGLGTLVAEIRAAFGRELVRLIHLNDSKGEAGMHRDRHEHIGKGAIGTVGFRRFLSHPLFMGIPAILETPRTADDDDRRNLRIIRKLLAGASPAGR